MSSTPWKRRLNERGRHSRQSPGQTGVGAQGKARTEHDKPDLPLMGDFADCWCGEKYGHDWEGKDKGRKHPR